MNKLLPKKSLGQNFLVNQGVVDRIVEAAELSQTDTVLEVGPGTGLLTRILATRAQTIIAVEKDHRIIKELTEEFAGSNTQIVEGDVLELKPENYHLKPGDYKIVANLPYYITGHFMKMVLEEWPKPKLMVLMVQKEVAQRMMAQPPDMNLLALSVQYFAKPEIIMYVSKGSFRPMPTVDSAVIKLTPHHQNAPVDQKLFEIMKKCFAGKRKQLITTLPGALGKTREETGTILQDLRISPQARPETLRPDDWLSIRKKIY